MTAPAAALKTLNGPALRAPASLLDLLLLPSSILNGNLLLRCP